MNPDLRSIVRARVRSHPLRRLRTAAELTQAKVADSMRRQRNWVSEIERCADKISLADFPVIANLLCDVDPDLPAPALMLLHVRRGSAAANA